MSFAQTAALGALAGFTIYLGLPFGRLQLLDDRARVALAMFSVGVLAFIFVDVMEHSFRIVEAAVRSYRHGSGTLGPGRRIWWRYSVPASRRVRPAWR